MGMYTVMKLQLYGNNMLQTFKHLS